MTSSKIFVGFFVCFTLALLLYLFRPFLLNIFIAALLGVALSNVNVKFLTITKGQKKLSAALTTVVLFLLFIAPLFYAITSLVTYLATFNPESVNETIEYIKHYQFSLPDAMSFLEPNLKEFLSDFDPKPLVTKVLEYATNIGKMSFKFISDLLVILIFFFFVELYGSELVCYLKNTLPLSKDDSQSILSEVANVMSVVFYSIIINMILQGFLFAIITMIYGYDGFLTGILYGFASLIPVIGGMLAWGPISAHEFASGNTGGAIVIALYTIIMISIIADTFLKPLVIKFINSKLVTKPTNLNELLIFFAMIAGIATFGFWGIIIGPAIIAFFISTIKLYVLLRERQIF
ncbi:MAG: AI-2E family transporter [Campylobacter sp.]|nr:AI-2E family transporter [Campylobacter sp.]